MKTLLILFFIILVISCTNISTHRNTNLDNGFLDLKDHDFSNSGNVCLNGTWKFKWMNNQNTDLITVPSYWDSDKYSDFGYGWYTLKIEHNSKKKLGLYLVRAHSSYHMYINDKLLLSNGYPGNSKDETIPYLKPQLVKLPDESPIIIKWKVSNYHHFKGGAYYTPVIGSYDGLKYMFHLANLIDSILIGAFLVMFIHYLILFLRKKNERVHLYFGMLCLFIFFRTLASEHFLQTLLPHNLVLIYKLSNKIDYLCVSLAAISLIILFKELIPEFFSVILNKILLTIWTIYTLFVLITPMLIFQRLHTAIELLMILTIISVIVRIIASIIKGQKKYLFTLIGSIILFITVINDILIFNNLIISMHLTHLGLFFFILANSIVISDSFAKAFIKAEYLSNNLEIEVKKKTSIIEDQKNELQEIYNDKTSYFVNIAHEIRTPLTLIKNYMDNYIDKVGYEEDLIVVKNNFNMLIRNITNIFNLQSIELGKITYNHNNIVEVTQYIEDKLTLFKSLSLSKKIILKTDITSNKVYTKIDPVAFDNIINNLIENAIKYTNEFGEIHISVSVSDNIKIIIFNSGEGIPENQLKKIYKPYYQIKHEKKHMQGIGLGLSIVKKIIEEVSGTIDVCSEESKGTKFTIQLLKCIPPVNGQTDITYPKLELSDKYLPSQLKPNNFIIERCTIMIVEDNIELLAFLQSIFYNEYNVFCAQCGSDAINQLHYIPRPDIIISDIMMGNTDGLNFYKQINSIDKFKNIPIIFLTAKAGDDYKHECLKSGAIDYLSKPFDKSELTLKVSSILNITKNIQGNVNSIEERRVKLDKLYVEYGVSKRQVEIINLLKEGLERKEIAYELGISINTVKTQLHRLFEKCEVNNKTELIKIFN